MSRTREEIEIEELRMEAKILSELLAQQDEELKKRNENEAYINQLQENIDASLLLSLLDYYHTVLESFRKQVLIKCVPENHQFEIKEAYQIFFSNPPVALSALSAAIRSRLCESKIDVEDAITRMCDLKVRYWKLLNSVDMFGALENRRAPLLRYPQNLEIDHKDGEIVFIVKSISTSSDFEGVGMRLSAY